MMVAWIHRLQDSVAVSYHHMMIDEKTAAENNLKFQIQNADLRVKVEMEKKYFISFWDFRAWRQAYSTMKQ